VSAIARVTNTTLIVNRDGFMVGLPVATPVPDVLADHGHSGNRIRPGTQ
jgi:hypothetical protein